MKYCELIKSFFKKLKENGTLPLVFLKKPGIVFRWMRYKPEKGWCFYKQLCFESKAYGYGECICENHLSEEFEEYGTSEEAYSKMRKRARTEAGEITPEEEQLCTEVDRELYDEFLSFFKNVPRPKQS